MRAVAVLIRRVRQRTVKEKFDDATGQTVEWWYGDNHLARSMELAGLKQVKVLGLPVRHVHEATAAAFDLKAAKALDRLHWEEVTRRTALRTSRARPMPRGTRLVRREWRSRPPEAGSG
jgi:hypothetical protein